MLDATARVRAYLAGRVDWEPNPYYKGRYQVALATVVNAGKGLSLPYEVAEILFRDSRFARKIERWLEQRAEQFPICQIRFDGSLGDWLIPKKSVRKIASVERRDVRTKAAAA